MSKAAYTAETAHRAPRLTPSTAKSGAATSPGDAPRSTPRRGAGRDVRRHPALAVSAQTATAEAMATSGGDAS